MPDNAPAIKIAMIGAGPRGLGAIEALINCRSAGDRPLELIIFDDLMLAGAGPNFDPAQTPYCVLNTPLRDIELAPTFPLPCGSFRQWQKEQDACDGERFPTRAELGTYLTTRFQDVTGIAGSDLALTTHAAHVSGLLRKKDGWHVSIAGNSLGPFDEVVLVPGQPRTAPDKQCVAWADHARKNDLCFTSAYPDVQLLAAARDWTTRAVAIRGLGLSTFDVLRILTVGCGGSFENGAYEKSGAEPERILAFSLDGQPPFPKPVDKAHDDRFNPNDKEIELFEAALAKAVLQHPEGALGLICNALVGPTRRIGSEMGAECKNADINDWLETERKSPGGQESRAATDTLRQGIGMAAGTIPPTVGYIIGQLWRKLQDQLRAGFNGASIEPDTACAIVGFDDGLKRYSYGPPLASSQELLALIDCNLVDLSVAVDPDIELFQSGWRLTSGDAEASVSVMIDAVISTPSLETVSDPLIVQLKSANLLQSKYRGSGANTRPDGRAISADGQASDGLCLLGRLASGSVIAVDSIHDCFGASSTRWAKGVLENGRIGTDNDDIH